MSRRGGRSTFGLTTKARRSRRTRTKRGEDGIGRRPTMRACGVWRTDILVCHSGRQGCLERRPAERVPIRQRAQQRGPWWGGHSCPPLPGAYLPGGGLVAAPFGRRRAGGVPSTTPPPETGKNSWPTQYLSPTHRRFASASAKASPSDGSAGSGHVQRANARSGPVVPSDRQECLSSNRHARALPAACPTPSAPLFFVSFVSFVSFVPSCLRGEAEHRNAPIAQARNSRRHDQPHPPRH